jgi:beta-galactosidase
VPVGAPINVVVTTCAASVQLYLNGVPVAPDAVEAARADEGAAGAGAGSVGSAGAVEMERYGYVQWSDLKFARGNLTVVGYDGTGNMLASKTLLTAGAPVRLEAWVEAPYGVHRNSSVIAPDGQDAALIGVRLLDVHGVLVPNADLNVTFTVAGPGLVIGVHNGDNADHSPDKGSWRRTFHGLARAIVASSEPGAVGMVTVTASAAGVSAGKAVLHAVAAE